MPKNRKYDKYDGGEWFYPRMTGFKQACCDCGLVHEWEFRIDKDGNLKARLYRNSISTSLLRRQNDHKFKDRK